MSVKYLGRVGYRICFGSKAKNPGRAGARWPKIYHFALVTFQNFHCDVSRRQEGVPVQGAGDGPRNFQLPRPQVSIFGAGRRPPRRGRAHPPGSGLRRLPEVNQLDSKKNLRVISFLVWTS